MPNETAVATASRLLSQVRYLETFPDTTLEELAQVYNTTVSDIEHDIALLLRTGATMFPDDLIDVVRDDDFLSIRSNAQFSQTLQLSLPEAVALAFGLHNIAPLVSPAEQETIRQVLAKLSEAAGRHFTVLVQTGAGSDEFAAELSTIQQALDTNHRVRFRYASWEQPSYKPREVFPYKVVLQDGTGYLVGVDAQDATDTYRLYRLDRMQDLQVSEHRTTWLRPPSEDVSQPFQFAETAPQAQLLISKDWSWLAEQPHFRIQKRLANGDLQVRTPVVSTQWLRSFLIQYAEGVRLLGPKALKSELAQAVGVALEPYVLQ